MNCCNSYGQCTQGFNCCTREQAYDATLQNWQGGQQIEHGMPVQMFEAEPRPAVVERPVDRALRYAEAGIDWICDSVWTIGIVLLVGAATGICLLIIWHSANAYITWRGL